MGKGGTIVAGEFSKESNLNKVNTITSIIRSRVQCPHMSWCFKHNPRRRSKRLKLKHIKIWWMRTYFCDSFHFLKTHLVDNLILLQAVKCLRGHRINNSLTFLTESHITTTFANYLSKSCVRFIRHLNVKTSNFWLGDSYSKISWWSAPAPCPPPRLQMFR